MNLQDGIYSLILECNLSNLGYIRLYNTVVAGAGPMFIRPIGINSLNNMNDELFGFQIATPTFLIHDFMDRKSGLPFYSSAKLAIDKALRS